MNLWLSGNPYDKCYSRVRVTRRGECRGIVKQENTATERRGYSIVPAAEVRGRAERHN